MERAATAYGKLNRVDLEDVEFEEYDLELDTLFPGTTETDPDD